MNKQQNQRGFVLITSLIFLVVVTLLAVSAINKSTLQEKIAANTRARENAAELANAALREAETLLAAQIFDSYQQSGKSVTITNGSGDTTTSFGLKIWRRGGMFGTSEDASVQTNETTTDEVARFLDAELWSSSGATQYTAPQNADGETTDVAEHFETEYYVAEYAFNGRDLNPDTAATADGTAIYRITARAEGQGGAAVAVTQSRYAKNY